MNKQTLTIGIWEIKSKTTKQSTYAMVNKLANPIGGVTVDEILALKYIAKNTENSINKQLNMIGVDSINRFTAELICQSDDRKMMLKCKKHLLKSVK